MQPLSFRSKIFFLLSLTYINIYVRPQDTQEVKEEQTQSADSLQEKLQDEFAQVKQQLSANLFKLDNILQQHSLDINHGNIRTEGEDDREHRRNAVRHCRQEIATYVRTVKGMVTSEPKKISDVLSFMQEFIKYLDTVIQKQFKNAALFKRKETRGPSVDEEIAYAEIHQQCMEHKKTTEALQSKSDSLIYPWYSKAFRTLSKGYEKARIGTILEYSPLVIAAAYGLYVSDLKVSWFRDIKIPCSNKLLIGWSTPAIRDIVDKAIYHDQYGFFLNRGSFSIEDVQKLKAGPLTDYIETLCPKGTLGYVADSFNRAAQDHFGTLVLATLAVGSKFRSLKTKMGTFFHKKWSSFSNWLKGGYYTQQEQEENYQEITFDDVQGNEAIKEKLRLNILKFIEDPERFMRQGIAPERGWLFTGPPGTGKTLMAKALGGEIRKKLKELGKENKLAFKYWNSSQVVHYGIDSIVEYMKQHAPCVIFIDELDLLHLQRVGNSDLLAKFLTTLDGCATDPDKPVWILAATNQPQNIDPALKRAGRLNNVVPFGPPTLQDRREFLHKLLHNLAIDTTHINIDKLAYETDACLYKDLESMIGRALYGASIKGDTIVNQELIEQNFNTEIRNIIDQDTQISRQEKEITAIHQIGIALAHFLLQARPIVSEVTIKAMVAQLKEETQWDKYYQSSDKKQKEVVYGEVFTFLPENSIGIESLQDRVTQCKILLAGNIAEKVLHGSCGYSYRPENKYNAFRLARDLACEGIHFELLSDELKDKVTTQAWEVIKKYEQELTELLTEYKPYLTLLSMLLLDLKSMSGEQIVHLLNLDKSEVEEILKKLTEEPQEELEQESPAEAPST